MAGMQENNSEPQIDELEITNAEPIPFPDDLLFGAVDDGEGRTKKSSRSNTMVAFWLTFSVVALLGGLAYFLWERAVIDLPYMQSNYKKRILERYVTIGPLMATFGKDQHVQMTLKIECKNTKLRRQLTQMRTAIENSILQSLKTPGLGALIARQDYESLKPFLVEQINGLLDGNPIQEVLFSDIVRYN